MEFRLIPPAISYIRTINDTLHSIHVNIKTYQNHRKTIIHIEENKETTANSRDQEGFRRFLEARTLES